MATTGPNPEIGFDGCDGEIVRDVAGSDAELMLCGPAGNRATVRIVAPGYRAALLDGQPADALLGTEGLAVRFARRAAPRARWHRKLAPMTVATCPPTPRRSTRQPASRPTTTRWRCANCSGPVRPGTLPSSAARDAFLHRRRSGAAACGTETCSTTTRRPSLPSAGGCADRRGSAADGGSASIWVGDAA